MNIEARFTHTKVQFDKSNKSHLVITLKAPKLDWQSKRMPICVIPVIDVSGSMQGDKLAYTKQSVMKLIDNLKPGDYCGLFTFGNGAREISAPVEMTQAKKNELKAKVGGLEAREMTNFSAGLVAALEKINQSDLPAGTLLRVIMFTDGQANQGVTDPAGLTKVLDSHIGKASVSFFGYGHDANQDLLADLATKGNGNYAFVKNPEDALTAFAKELGGLLSTYAQDIALNLTPYGEHKFVEVVSDVDVESANGQLKIKIPDLLSEEERHIVVAVEFAAQKSAGPRSVNAVDLEVSFSALDDTGKTSVKNDSLKAKVQFVKDGEAQEKPDETLASIVATALLVQAQIEAEKKVQVGDFAGARQVMRGAGDLLGWMGQYNHANVAQTIGATFMDSHSYASNNGYLKSMKKGLTRSSSYTSDATAFRSLEVLGSVSFNDAQEQLTKAFVGTEDTEIKVEPTATPSSSLAKSKSKRW